MQAQLWLFLCIIPLMSAYLPPCNQPNARRPTLPKPTPPLVPIPSSLNKELTLIYEARSVDFAFPSEEERDAALADGRYDPAAILPIDVDVYYPKKRGEPQVFMTMPRFGRGSPYSLARLVKGPNGTQAEAYPNYSWHSSYGEDCDGLTSVYRIKIDACDRMWILDSGEISRIHTCQPQVVVIDMPTQTVVHRYRLPENVFHRNESRLVTIAVDIADPPPRGRCNQAFVYIADPTSSSIIVYDVVNQQSWRVENMYTHADPNFSTHTLAGESFQLMDGAFGLSVTPRNLGLKRMLYFHALSSDRQAAVPLDVINNAENFQEGPDSSLEHFIDVGHRNVHCSIAAMTPQGYLMCGFFNPIALIAWDIRTPYIDENRIILAENPETLQFIGGLKVTNNKEGKPEVWMITNRAQKFFAGTTNHDEINYHILKCGLDELLTGKPCN